MRAYLILLTMLMLTAGSHSFAQSKPEGEPIPSDASSTTANSPDCTTICQERNAASTDRNQTDKYQACVLAKTCTKSSGGSGDGGSEVQK